MFLPLPPPRKILSLIHGQCVEVFIHHKEVYTRFSAESSFLLFILASFMKYIFFFFNLEHEDLNHTFPQALEKNHLLKQSMTDVPQQGVIVIFFQRL